MEKKVPSHNLEAIKATFSHINKLRMSSTALRTAREMGFSREDMVNTIQQLKRKDFVKSMTTYNDHKIWQDVYNTQFNAYVLYVKFQKDSEGYFIISFKKK